MKRISLALLVIVVSLLVGASSAWAYIANLEVLRNHNGTRVPTDDAVTIGPLTPAPSVDVRIPGTLTAVTPVLHFGSSYPRDLDIALEAPDHRFIVLMSDSCTTVTNSSMYFNDLGTALPNVGDCNDTSPKPTNNEGTADTFTTLTPGATPVSSLASFDNMPARGTWRYHVQDDASGDSSYFYDMDLRLTTAVDPALGYTAIPTEDTVEMSKPFTGARQIEDIDVVLRELSHRYPEGLDVFIQSPAGTVATLVSDACAGTDINGADWTFDDEASQVVPETDNPICSDSPLTVKPTNFGASDSIEKKSLLADGSYPSQLSIFDGQYPSGNWRLILNGDDSAGGGLIKSFDLAITMKGAKKVAPSTPKLKFKKSGKKIKATARVGLGGDAPTVAECGGNATTEFQRKVTSKKGKKKSTVYKRVVKSSSPISFKNNSCGYDISAKIPKSYKGRKLRVQTTYLGGDFIAPFVKKSDVKIK